MKKTVVVLYSKDHYDQVALAIQEYLGAFPEKLSFILIDETKYSNFGSSKFVQFMYKFTIRNMPWLNRLMNYFTNKYFITVDNHNKKKTAKAVNSAVVDDTKPSTNKGESKGATALKTFKTKFRKVDNIFSRFNPEIVICCTTKGLHKSLIARSRTDFNPKIYAVMTDYCTNRGFVNDGTDGYIVQNDMVKSTLLTLGVAEEKIFTLGTPILSKTKAKYNREEVLNELKIEDKTLPNIVLVGGRFGSGKMKDAFKDLALYADKLNVIVLTNKSLWVESFIKQYCKSANITKNIYYISTINNISKLYSIADVFVSAPTAQVTYEAMSRNLPCVLVKDSNYLENGNFSYLTANGYAMRGEKTSHVVPSVLSIVNKDKEYKELMANIKGSFTQNAAKTYGDFILDLLSEEKANKEESEEEKND